MVDKILYKLNEATGKFEYVNTSIPEKSLLEKFIERGKVSKNGYHDPKGIFKDFDNWLKNGRESAVDNLFDWIPWMKIGHFFADLSVVVSLSLLVWYCYGVMIGTKNKREQYAQKIYVSMIAVFVTKCLEVLSREK